MKRIGKRLISVLLIALMVCVMLPTTAFAALETGEDRQCKFQILYVSDEFYVGYNYGDSWNVTYTCQYTTGHSGYNHSIACSVIKEQVDKAKGMVSSDWDIKGWSKEAKASPTIFTTYTGTTATQTSYTIYIVAKKNAVTTNYSLSYDGNGASSGVPATQNGSSTTGSYTFDVSTQKPVRDGYEFLGWSSVKDGSVDIGATVTLTSAAPTKTIFAAWKALPVQTYTVTYTDGVDGEEVFPDQVTSDILSGTDTPAFNGTLTREGYVFYGWNPAVAEKVTADATYIATWEVDANGNGKADKDEDKYTVTYTDGVDDEEIFVDQVTSGILSGTATPAFDGTPARKGYVFYGWNPAVAEKVTADATYIATWEVDANGNGKADKDEDKYTVTYTDGVDDEEIFVDQVTSGILSGTATPAFDGTPARKGYVFYGWNPVVAEKVTADATYTATWEVDANGNGKADKDEEKYTVIYTDGVDDEEVFADQVTSGILSGTVTPAFKGTPAREGYVFKGWNPTVAEKVTADTTYIATWEAVPAATYTVSFNMNGHGTQVAAQTVEEGGKAIKPADPKETGYKFAGWYADATFSTKFDFDTEITANTTVYAKWTKDSVAPTDPTSPQTGDNSNVFLWIALLFVSCGALIGTTVYGKKRSGKRCK